MNHSTDNGIIDGITIISYVANDEGNQELVSSSTWNPVDIVNRQAWQQIEKKIEYSKAKVAAGRVSCLHYYMTANQMDRGLLAGYTSQSRWAVSLHMIPFFFKRLRVRTLKKYSVIFKVTIDDLMSGELKPPVYNQQECEVEPFD